MAVEVDDAAVAAMIDTYQETGDKDWIEATVTIDGRTFEQVGLRLKGNSSLRGVVDGADPADLPWLLRLDEYVDGQALSGWTSRRSLAISPSRTWSATPTTSTDRGTTPTCATTRRGGSNVLVERFTAVEEWADLLTSQAGELVDADTVTEEADAIREVVAEGS